MILLFIVVVHDLIRKRTLTFIKLVVVFVPARVFSLRIKMARRITARAVSWYAVDIRRNRSSLSTLHDKTGRPGSGFARSERPWYRHRLSSRSRVRSEALRSFWFVYAVLDIFETVWMQWLLDRLRWNFHGCFCLWWCFRRVMSDS